MWKGITAFSLFILLSACTGDAPKVWTRSEIEDIAEDYADAAASQKTGEVSDLADRVDHLEREVKTLHELNASQAAEIKELYANQQNLVDWVNRAHGLK